MLKLDHTELHTSVKDVNTTKLILKLDRKASLPKHVVPKAKNVDKLTILPKDCCATAGVLFEIY